jgi:hypothetical protein
MPRQEKHSGNPNSGKESSAAKPRDERERQVPSHF